MEHQQLAPRIVPRTAPDLPLDPTLAQLVTGDLSSRGGGLPATLVSQVVLEIAAELDALHDQGRTHGDVRAGRIAVPPASPAYLLGLERASAPEGGGDGGEDAVHSLGVTVDRDITGLVTAAFFAINGEPPDRPARPSSPADAAPDRRPPFHFLRGQRAGSAESIPDVFARGLALRRGTRYASAGAFAAALQAAASTPPSPPAERTRPWRFPSLNLPLAAGGRLVLGGGALLALGVWLGRQGRQEPTYYPSPAVFRADAVPPAPRPGPSPAAPSPLYQPPPGRAMQDVWLPPRPMPTQAILPSKLKPAAARVAIAQPPATADAPASRRPARPRRRRAGPTLVTQRPAVSEPEPMSSRCLLRVYARQFLSRQDMLDNHIRLVRPQRVLVDGLPSTSLAAGLWTPMAPGVHLLAFYPDPGGPFDPNVNFRVRLGPRRQSFQIPLPRHLDPDSSQPFLPTPSAVGQARSQGQAPNGETTHGTATGSHSLPRVSPSERTL